jgi:hypothetical protein
MRKTACALLFAAFLTGCCSRTCTDSAGEQGAAAYFDSVRQQPAPLQAFLRAMPKGGDLHNHLSGAVYAETYIDFATKTKWCVSRSTKQPREKSATEACKQNEDGMSLCFDRKTGTLVAPTEKLPCDDKEGRPAASEAYTDPALYHDMVDAFSMRNFVPHCDFAGSSDTTVCESGHDHFFATFDKFDEATKGHAAEMIAETVRRAAAQNETYLELMFALDQGAAKGVSDLISWDGDDVEQIPGAVEVAQRDARFAAAIQDGVQRLAQLHADWHSRLHGDDSQHAEPGCAVEVRYLYQVPRGIAPKLVLARTLTGFAMAEEDKKQHEKHQLVVGLNLVMPEDWYIPMRDFDKHMLMLQKLRAIYPQVHISLHAGELAPGLVPLEGLQDHIYKSVFWGGAQRIGHGLDIVYEDKRDELLKKMAKDKILVEICLTSNDGILGIRGPQHPLKLYLDNKVPVALATDDEGVSRSDMTQEYLRAAQTYDFLSYKDLKRMARMSLEHSFLPGASLWEDTEQFRLVAACADDRAGSDKRSSTCQQFLNDSEHALEQWKLEAKFVEFEKRF